MKSLSPSDLKEFKDSLDKTNQLIQEKRVFDSLQAISKAEALVPNHPSVEVVKASAYVELKDYNKAKDIFVKLLKLAPGNPSLIFNTGEMHFVQAEWNEALDYLNRALDGLYTSNHKDLYNLTKFKIYICHKKLGNKAKVDEYEKAYDFTSDSPIYYFINYVKFHSEDNQTESKEWLKKAHRVFKAPRALTSWIDTLQESGYLSYIAK